MDYCDIGHDDLDYIELWAWDDGRMRYVDADDFPCGHCDWADTFIAAAPWSGRIDHERQLITIAGYPRSPSHDRLFDIAVKRLANRHPLYKIWGHRGTICGNLELIG